MSHHKRRRPKHQRAGCLLCKSHKDEREAKPQRAFDAEVIREWVIDAGDSLDLRGVWR
jgi:hypothetical protein